MGLKSFDDNLLFPRKLHGDGAEQREGEEGQQGVVYGSQVEKASGAGWASKHHPIHLKVRGKTLRPDR